MIPWKDSRNSGNPKVAAIQRATPNIWCLPRGVTQGLQLPSITLNAHGEGPPSATLASASTISLLPPAPIFNFVSCQSATHGFTPFDPLAIPIFFRVELVNFVYCLGRWYCYVTYR
ncbi:unnamed protein product [Dicrocoelium dendriticum]|nr:unnamed protein product [Dicrocoelium dendriticum]